MQAAMVKEGRWSVAPAASLELQRLALLDRLDEVLTRSAIVSHPNGNRRYHNILLEVRTSPDKEVWGFVVNVTDLNKFGGKGDPSEFVAYDECPHCIGKGCPLCDEGLVKTLKHMPKPANLRRVR